MAVQTTRDSRYDYYNTGELFPNWDWYFRKFPDEKTATISAWSSGDGLAVRARAYNQLNAWRAENPGWPHLVGTSTLACIHYRLGDLKPTQQIVINEYKGTHKEGRSDPPTFKVGMLLTPDFHAKVNWGQALLGGADSLHTMPQYLKGVVTELAKNSFGDMQITLLHEMGLKRYLIPNRMRLQFISETKDGRGPMPGHQV